MTDAPDLYVSRPQIVEAKQWDGTVRSSTRIAEWAPSKTRLTDGYNLELLAGKDGAQEWVPVPVGHWLVRLPGDPSDIWPVDPDYFAAKYEAAPQPETDEPREPKPIDLIHELHRAVHGDTWARPETPRAVWGELLTKVRGLAQGQCGECIRREVRGSQATRPDVETIARRSNLKPDEVRAVLDAIDQENPDE